MGIRLNKVLTELNIGLQTAVDFLKNKTSLGEIRDDVTTNTKISDQQYEALVEAFSTDKAVKTQADKLFPKKPKEKRTVSTDSQTTGPVKTKTEEEMQQRQQFRPLGKIDLSSLNKPKPAAPAEPVAPVSKPANTPVQKETATAAVSSAPVKKEETTPEKKEAKAPVTPQPEAAPKKVETPVQPAKSDAAPEVKSVKPEPKPVKVEPMRRDVFFTINSTKVVEKEEAKVRDIVDYLNKYPKAKVSVTGYADAGTGNDRINDRLAAGRADIVAKLLTEKYNIPADRIMKDSKGSRVQPFAENDLNRVSICIAE